MALMICNTELTLLALTTRETIIITAAPATASPHDTALCAQQQHRALQPLQGLDLRHRTSRKAFDLRRHMVLTLLLTPAEPCGWNLYRSTTSPEAKGLRQYHTSRWEGCNLYLDLSQARALDAMGLPDDGSDLSESFLDARRGAMRDNLSGAATPILTNALLANGVIDRWKKSWDPKHLEWKRKRRILETEERGRRRGAQDAATRK